MLIAIEKKFINDDSCVYLGVVRHFNNSMETNFEIEENYAVVLNGVHIDLHNNFAFNEILEFENSITIKFIKLNKDWIHEKEFRKLNFLHKNVTFKYSETGDNSQFPEDGNTLSEITFFPKTSREVNDGFMQSKEPNKTDDIIYHFENGKLFRINCESIELIVEK